MKYNLDLQYPMCSYQVRYIKNLCGYELKLCVVFNESMMLPFTDGPQSRVYNAKLNINTGSRQDTTINIINMGNSKSMRAGGEAALPQMVSPRVR